MELKRGILMAIIGIDLGTTSSLVAYFDGVKPIIIPNQLGKTLTPSVVSINTSNEIFVGEIAKERLITHPQQTAYLFKRSMGSNRTFKLGEYYFLAEELSAILIGKLKEDAEVYLGKTIKEAVISVPAYFSDAQRKATQRAGALAGLKVEQIINEPSAAAIAYGVQQTKEHTRFLVFDLGGGTFDVSLLERHWNKLEVRSVAGDNFLGGEDFTVALMSLFLEEKKMRLSDLDTSTHSIIKQAAEKAKLGIEAHGICLMKYRLGEEEHEVKISIDEYEKRCEPLLKRLQRPIQRAIADAGINVYEIDHIILVGGGTKLRLIRQFVSKLFGRLPDFGIDAIEAVAKGVAIQAGLKDCQQALEELTLIDVCPYTLGTEIAIPRPDKGYDGGYFHPIIERNTPIPVSRVDTLYTLKDNQSTVAVAILQGENRLAKDNIPLATLHIPVPKAKAGKEAIEVRYTYDSNGILEVEVIVKSTGLKKQFIIENTPNHMSKEEIQQRLERLQHLKIHPRESEVNQWLLAKGERLYQETIGELRGYIGELMAAFEQVLDTQDHHKVDEIREEIERVFHTIEKRF